MTGEHEPPTDEELAELEWLHTNVVKIVAERGEGRLTQDDALLAAFPRLIARVRQLEKENRDLIFGGAVQTAIVGKRMVELDEFDRTLTLPNGTVVRAGEVLVVRRKAKVGIIWTEVALVTAVGRESFLHQELAYYPDNIAADEATAFDLTRNKDLEGTEDMCMDPADDWQPWSEVYPDRPVPGGGE